MTNLPLEMLAKAMTYESYANLFDKVVAEKSTTGPNQSEDYVHYTELNWHRFKRVNKTFHVAQESEEIIAALAPQTWVLLTETWCGDAAHSVPVIAKIAECNPKISLQILLRDENLPLMDLFLTNGGRSIPKLIICEGEDLQIRADWGPRPEALQNDFLRMKKEQVEFEAIKIHSQNWYNSDKGKSIVSELINLLINQ